MEQNNELQQIKCKLLADHQPLEISMKGQQLQHEELQIERNEGARWTKLVALTGLAATLGSAVPAGYCIGVMNSPAVHMRAWCNESLIMRYDMHLSDAAIELLWSLIVSIFLVGGAVGSLSGAWAANKFGRKGSYIGCGFLFMVGAILFYWCRMAQSVEMLLIGRFAVGLASGLTTACLPMYLSEIAPLSIRGTLGPFCAMGLSAGVVVGQVVSLRDIFGSNDWWHVAISFYVLFVIVCYAPAIYYPESPKWLYIVRGDKDAAREQLKRLRGNVKPQTITKEIEEMEAELNANNQNQEPNGFRTVLTNHKFILPLVIVCVYQGGQQLSGINAIFFYSVSIFRTAGLSPEAAEWANLATGTLNLSVSLLGPILMSRFNRRPLMLFSSGGCVLSLLLFIVMLKFIDSVSWFAMGCIASIFLYIIFFQAGLGPMPFFIGAELFEVAPRPAAMSVGSLASWMCNFLVAMTFPSLQNIWGPFVFLPFSITCMVIFAITKLYLPETRGRDPSEVAPLVANGFKSKVI